eukprot:TRINITY_DN15669_c0_g1_i1.p1 TRINITY_DN15669_c0_g1~~TRINITY_DN15669_c0_g1_i1.p1  ORF type:complete len:222 (-),score=28.71 TRINITY_DN15669_c0_g1_i1:58-693(-)
MKVLIAAALVCVYANVAYATWGLDVSSLVSRSDFECLKRNGFDFAVMRGWEELGRVDPNAASTVANAWAAGFAHVDLYFFPCWTCGNAAGQVRDAVQGWHSRGIKYGMMWFDIETPCNLGCSGNAAFLRAAVAEARSLGVNFGIYSSEYMWSKCMCESKEFSAHPLWYAQWDNEASFNDFGHWGGWARPAVKQTSGGVNVCGANLDHDWYP